MLEMFPELLLSLVVLILVLYGLGERTIIVWSYGLKVLIVVLILVGLISFLLGYFVNQNLFPFLKYVILDIVGNYGVNGLLLTSGWVEFCKGVLVIACGFLLLMHSKRKGGDSWIMLVLIVLLGSLLLVASVNWLSIYLALELQTLTLFILVSTNFNKTDINNELISRKNFKEKNPKKGNFKDSAYSIEAGLKYFVLGAVSSGLFLFGCALLYGVSGETSIQGINSLLLGDVGKILITVSLLFKLSVAPFHMWAPDVYEGAPTITTALLAILPKIGVFSVLVQVGLVSNVVLFCGVLSIIYGAIGALNQTKMKRLLAYSGIGHMGFLIFGVAIGSFESIQASLVYIIIYILMSICVFSVVLSLNLTRGLIIEVNSLSRENPVMALTLALTFLSIAGIPPLAGFLGKWLILLSGMSRGYYLICMMIVVVSVIAGVYYVRVVQVIYFPQFSPNFPKENWRNYLNPIKYTLFIKLINRVEVINFRKSIILGVVLFLILFLMVSPNWVLQITHDATISVYR